MVRGLFLTGLASCLAAAPVHVAAQDSRITADLPEFSFTVSDTTLTVTRSGAACPPACIQPIQAAPGIATIGELELMEFLDHSAARGTGLLIDTRLPEGYAGGTLPGAVNVPAETLAPGNPYRDDLLAALGVQSGNFDGAYDLVFFAGGPDAPEAPEALRSLLDAGYPASKLKYYRSGTRGWAALGLSMAAGE